MATLLVQALEKVGGGDVRGYAITSMSNPNIDAASTNIYSSGIRYTIRTTGITVRLGTGLDR